MNIIFCGQFEDASGYGNAARNYLRAFDKNNIRNQAQFYIYNLSFETNSGLFLTEEEKVLNDKYKLTQQKLNSLVEKKDYILINFQVPHIPQKILIESHDNHDYKKLLKSAKKNITMVVWETDTVPAMWKDCVFQDIIVPCEWNYNTFKSQTKSNVYTLPYPLKNQQLKENRTTTNTFNILSISQWSHRKGFDTLLKAYCSEFFDDSDVCLIIKTYRNEIFNSNKEEEKAHIINDIKAYKALVYDYNRPSNAKIKLITDVISKDKIDLLYDEADVFCLTTRGEGFGLTIAEASSKGLPCIVPDKGGHIDFLDKENNFLYDSHYTTVINCRGLYSSKNMKYVESNIDDLRLKMRTAYNLWKSNELYDMGKKSKLFIDNYLNDVNITKNFIDIMQRINNE